LDKSQKRRKSKARAVKTDTKQRFLLCGWAMFHTIRASFLILILFACKNPPFMGVVPFPSTRFGGKGAKPRLNYFVQAFAPRKQREPPAFAGGRHLGSSDYDWCKLDYFASAMA
jgi:hypothetical protein